MVNAIAVLLAVLLAVAVVLWRRERAARIQAEAHATSLEAFASEIQSATERERAEISRSMHDQIGGILVASKMDLDWIGRRLPAADETVRTKLAQVGSALDSGLSIKRGFVERLRPSILDHLGLFAALQWQLNESCGAAGVEATASVDDGDPGFAPESAIRVFRIAHAAIGHALAAPEVSLVALDAHVRGETLEVDLTDDGTAGTTGPPAWLAALDHRAQSLGGGCTVERRPDGGSRLRLRIPAARLMTPPTA